MVKSSKAVVVLGFVMVIVIGMIFMQPVVTAANENTGLQSVANESATAQVGSYVDLGGYNIKTGSETVYGYNDSTGNYEVASEGTDYEIAYGNGSVKALNGSSLIDDGEEIKVRYDYQASDDLSATVIGFIPVMLATLLLWVAARGVQKEL